MQSNEIIDLLERKDVRRFIDSHFQDKPDNLALKYRDKVDFDLSKLTKLLHIYQKAQHKIPVWVEHRCALSQKNYEQCTDLRVARFKASLFKGKHLVDATCGLGVDTYCFSDVFEHVTAYERDEATYQNAAYNFEKLGVKNIELFHGTYSDQQLDTPIDVLYVDPDRRIVSDTQQKAIESWSPDVVQAYQGYLKQANQVVFKVSPMLDLTYLINQFDHLTDIYVIALDNEVKELLLVSQRDHIGPPSIKAVDITKNTASVFEASDVLQNVSPEPNERTHVIEPSRAIIKAGLVDAFQTMFQVEAFGPKSIYGFGSSHINSVHLRAFERIEHLDLQWKSIRKNLKSRGINQINIAARQFPESVAKIRQRLNIPDGGNHMLIFSTKAGKTVCYLCKLPAKKST